MICSASRPSGRWPVGPEGLALQFDRPRLSRRDLRRLHILAAVLLVAPYSAQVPEAVLAAVSAPPARAVHAASLTPHLVRWHSLERLKIDEPHEPIQLISAYDEAPELAPESLGPAPVWRP